MQYVLFQNKGQPSTFPYLLNIQNDLMTGLETRVVIPLYDFSLFRGVLIPKLNPVITVRGQDYLLMTQLISCIRRSLLGAEIMVLTEHDAVDRAVKFLLQSN